ncbi:MAG: protease modulator HflC [Gammaproteobacteria bacterium]|nr:protease modulator HflC [Gammaproteobacteria bacterium]
MKLSPRALMSIGFIVLIILFSSFYTVNQRFVGMEKFLGRVALDNKQLTLQQPGLHMKLPFLTTVVYFDTRLQTLGSKPERIPTKDQKFVYVDYFVKWRIKDYYQFYLTTGNEFSRVIDLLKPKVSDSLKMEFGKKTLEEVVSEDRANIMAKIKNSLVVKAAQLGVDIIDMRIKKIDLPEEVRESVYNRMRTKRQKVANAHRYEGQKKSEQLRAEADFNSKRIIAEANKKAEIMRGEADAKVASIYSNSYNRDPEFYQFYRSLRAYDNILSENNNILVLSPDSDFFKYFTKQGK